MSIFIIIGLVIIVFGLASIKIPKYNNYIQEEANHRTRLDKLRSQIYVLESKRQQQLKDIDSFDVIIQNQKNNIEIMFENERAALGKKIESEKAQAALNLENFKDSIEKEKEALKKEINKFYAQRAAIVEANKREEEIKLHQDFYRINLSLEAQEDIDKIFRIAKDFHNPQILYKLIWSEYVQSAFKSLWDRVGKKTAISGVYKITNLKNSKVYIGQSTNIKDRWTGHIKASLGIDSIAHQRLHDEIRNEGIQNFTFEILQECPKDQLNKVEKDFIQLYQSDVYGYNSTSGNR